MSDQPTLGGNERPIKTFSRRFSNRIALVTGHASEVVSGAAAVGVVHVMGGGAPIEAVVGGAVVYGAYKARKVLTAPARRAYQVVKTIRSHDEVS